MTKNCPYCGNAIEDTIDLGDADAGLEGLKECGCGAVFTEKAEHDGFASAYLHPRLGFNLYRVPGLGRYVSVPDAPDGMYELLPAR